MAREVKTVFASAARTATPTAVEVALSPQSSMLTLLVDVTAVVTTPSITVTVKGLVPGSGTEYTLLTSAAITAVGVTQLEIGPGLTAVANEVVSAALPQTLKVEVTHADADSITYSIVAVLI